MYGDIFLYRPKYFIRCSICVEGEKYGEKYWRAVVATAL
jgi:hypothetical protein